MGSDKEFDKYLNNLDSEDQRALNAYMDNLDLEYNPQLDEYLDRIEEQSKPPVRSSIWNKPVDEASEDKPQPDKALADAAPEDNNSGDSGTGAGLNPRNLSAYVELEPEIESFQDYTTSRMKTINPSDYVSDKGEANVNVDNSVSVDNAGRDNTKYDNDKDPLDVSLLNGDYEPYIDTLRYKDEEGQDTKRTKDKKNNKKSNKKNNPMVNNNPGADDNYDNILYIDNIPKSSKAPVVITIILLLVLVGAGGFALYRYTDVLDFVKKNPVTEATTELAVTTEAATEEATTEEPVGPYATVDYTLHSPNTTDSTIVYDSNSYSLKFPQEEWPIARDDNGKQRELSQDELYPAITLEAVEGSLNYTSPNPDNLAETQVMTSRYMVLVDLSDDSIVAKRDSDVVVNPASMTKILTVLTAADMIEDLDDTFTITHEDIRYAMENDCSAVGFLEGETVTVRDLIYGTIVCSGADAAVGLAEYCCGGQEAFVEKMNEKVEELGISDTAHFTNVVGVYDENLHCTMEDMAVIISTAVQNELLADVLNTRIYQTTPDPGMVSEDVYNRIQVAEDGTLYVEPKDDAGTNGNNETDTDQGESAEGNDQADDAADADDNNTGDTSADNNDDITDEDIERGVLQVAKNGIQISNMFMRRIEDKDTGGEVLGAKTGFVNAAGFCCASYYRSNSGKEYVCVTGDTYSSWRCIYDHVGIYRSLAK